MIAITNKSSKVSDYECRLFAWACGWQLVRDVAPAWGRIPRSVIFFTGIVPLNAWEIAVMDNADQADTLGYHSLNPQGLPYGRVFCDGVLASGGRVLRTANSIAAVMSHEICETFIDENCSYWADGPNGTAYSLEVGDPVEADSYDIVYGSVSVAVSNFVYPQWFNTNPPANAQFDQMRRCSAPFSLTPGGYQVIFKEGQTSQLTARTNIKPAMIRHDPSHPASRTFKRLHRNFSRPISSSPPDSPFTARTTQ